VIGSDSFLELLTWRDPRGVVTRARLVVIPRAGRGFDPDAPAAQKVLSELGLAGFARVAGGGGNAPADPTVVLVAEATSLPLSGSELRRRAREGRSLAYRMPAQVVEYIGARGLYGRGGR
jgi:nicotinic acid mononucleotide adenylyltransferase